MKGVATADGVRGENQRVAHPDSLGDHVGRFVPREGDTGSFRTVERDTMVEIVGPGASPK